MPFNFSSAIVVEQAKASKNNASERNIKNLMEFVAGMAHDYVTTYRILTAEFAESAELKFMTTAAWFKMRCFWVEARPSFFLLR